MRQDLEMLDRRRWRNHSTRTQPSIYSRQFSFDCGRRIPLYLGSSLINNRQLIASQINLLLSAKMGLNACARKSEVLRIWMTHRKLFDRSTARLSRLNSAP